jgi:hypothetical protein
MKGDGAPKGAGFVRCRVSLSQAKRSPCGAPSRRLRQLRAALFVKRSNKALLRQPCSRQASLVSPGGAPKPLLNMPCEDTRRSAVSRSTHTTPREAPLRRAGIARTIFLHYGERMAADHARVRAPDARAVPREIVPLIPLLAGGYLELYSFAMAARCAACRFSSCSSAASTAIDNI